MSFVLLFNGGILTFSSSKVSFSAPNAAVQDVTITNGTGPYTVTSSNNSIVTASIISTNIIQIVPAGMFGTCTLTAQDSIGDIGFVTVVVSSGLTTVTYPTALIAIYKSTPGITALQSPILQILNVESYKFQVTQVGGLGTGSFVVNMPYENLGNVLAPNMVTVHQYEDYIASNAAVNATSISVNVGSRFAIGDNIVLYDGKNTDFTSVKTVSGNTLTLTSGLNSAYGSGTNVMTMRYRGMVSTVQKDLSLNNLHTVQCNGYQNELYWPCPASVQIANLEVGYALRQAVQTYVVGQSDLTMGNTWTMTNASNGTNNGSGTGMSFSYTYNYQTLDTIITDLIKQANSNANKIQYTLWVDINNAVNFGPIPTVTPTKTVSILPTVYAHDGHWDSMGAHTLTAEDTTQMVNAVTVQYTDPTQNNQTLAIAVGDATSIANYGQREGMVNSQQIASQSQAIDYAKGYLTVNAWPRQQSSTQFICTGSFVTPLDFVQITGFTDASTEQFNPITVERSWNAQAPYFFAMQITGQALLPDINSEINARNNEHPTGDQGFTSYFGDRIVQWGCDVPRNSDGSYTLGANNFTMTPGAIAVIVSQATAPGSRSEQTWMQYGQGQAVNQWLAVEGVGSFSQGVPSNLLVPPTPRPEDDEFVTPQQRSDLFTVAWLYRNGDGSDLEDSSGNSLAQVIYYNGATATNWSPAFTGQVGTVTSITDYQVIPLWQVNCWNGRITGYTDMRGGLG